MPEYGATQLNGLPDRVTIYEVGARDGLQNEKALVPLEIKAEFVRRLLAAGLRAVETTSFVRPEWVPQLADADRALEAGVREIAVFASATETFARRNLNRSLDESLAVFEPVVTRARAEGLQVRGYVSMCFGDPWEGAVKPAQVARIVTALRDMGAQEISLGDTIGVATPGRVAAVLDAIDVPRNELAVHFHDTYGQALSNTLTALRHGVSTVDSSAGGLGGCPYARSATGNLATEDLLWQLNGLGIDTGVDLHSLVATSVWMAEQLGRPSPSRVVNALKEN